MITARFGQFGPYIQKGEGETRQFASLGKGQLIENITLAEAISLLSLPRTVGEYEGIPVVATKGRFGPYIKHGDKNFSLPKGADPLNVTLEACIGIIESERTKAPVNSVILEFADSGISVLNGRYGPYIKQDGSNYKLPKGTDPSCLTEEACKEIINNSKPAAKTYKSRRKS